MTFITSFNLVVVFGIFCDTSIVDVLSFFHEVLNVLAVRISPRQLPFCNNFMTDDRFISLLNIMLTYFEHCCDIFLTDMPSKRYRTVRSKTQMR